MLGEDGLLEEIEKLPVTRTVRMPPKVSFPCHPGRVQFHLELAATNFQRPHEVVTNGNGSLSNQMSRF
jgi:hypothetical protein